MKTEKQFQCFVCGKIFINYEGMKTHILEVHEENREYLLCPLKHCRCPVRDLRIHFSNCHKHTKLPKVTQMKTMIWYDLKTGKKKKTNFKDGFMISKKNNGKSVHYRSSYEEQVYLCLEDMPEIVSYEVEPFFVPYFFRSKQKRYFPDLKVNFIDGHVEIWEVKPKAQKKSEQNKAKWKFCEDFCVRRGWQFKVITELEINNLKIESNNK